MRLWAITPATIFVVLASVGLASCSSRPEPQGPWCSISDYGTGNIVEDCRFESIEACRQSVLGGNRGTCTQNPRWPADGRSRRR